MDGPVVDDAGVTFGLADPFGRLSGVRLVQEIGLAQPLAFTRANGTWQLRVELPDVDRMEYLFELEDHNERRATVVDPANPLRAAGAFGDKSVVQFAGYRLPDWLDGVTVEHTTTELSGGAVDVTIWTPAALGENDPAPLLAVHDGPEFATLGGITQYVGVAIGRGDVPPCRVALLHPGDRNTRYSANDEYASALCTEALPAIPNTTVRIGLGASLGGLAMLHAHRRHPGTFDALFLQSSSFFTPQTDPQESQFDGFAAVTGFVESVGSSSADDDPVPVALTCGTVEENLANNEQMASTLVRLGYRADLVVVRDAHNFTAWRDALDPLLAQLIAEVVSADAA